MKKKAMKKLTLTRETLKDLQAMNIGIAGGTIVTTSDCFTYCIPCVTTANLPCDGTATLVPIGPGGGTIGPIGPGTATFLTEL